MKKLNFVWPAFALTLLLNPMKAEAQVDPNLQQRLNQGPLIIDHNDLHLFQQIPDLYIQRAKAITLSYLDRSVGNNVSEALNCLEHNWATLMSYCKSGSLTEAEYGITQDQYYMRTNWEFFWSDANLWNEVINAFFTELVPTRVNTNVVSFQINYLEFSGTSHVNDVPANTFAAYTPGYFYPYPNVTGRYDISDVEQLQADRPNQIFFHWTASLARIIGNQYSTQFNISTRNYVNANHEILLDYADIMSHAEDGSECLYNGYPALCAAYTNETSGGHLNGRGRVRIGKAFWIMMTQIAGWNPGTGSTTPTPSRTPTPTPDADFDNDGSVDIDDYNSLRNNFDKVTCAFNIFGDCRINVFDFNYLIGRFGI